MRGCPPNLQIIIYIIVTIRIFLKFALITELSRNGRKLEQPVYKATFCFLLFPCPVLQIEPPNIICLGRMYNVIGFLQSTEDYHVIFMKTNRMSCSRRWSGCCINACPSISCYIICMQFIK